MNIQKNYVPGDSEPPEYRCVSSDVYELYIGLKYATRTYRVHKELDITTKKFVAYVGRKAALQITYDRFCYIEELKEYQKDGEEVASWAEKFMKTLIPDRRNEIEKINRYEHSIFDDWEDDEQRKIDNKHIEGDVNECYPICYMCESLKKD